MFLVAVSDVYSVADDLTPLAMQQMALDQLRALYQRQEFVTVSELEIAVSQAYEELREARAVAA